MDEILLIQQQQQQAGQSSVANGRDTPSSSTDSDQETSPLLPSSPTAPGQGELSLSVKQQQMYIWNDNFEKWHECTVSLQPPRLYIKEHEDTRIEIQDKQLQHHKEKWFHGGISRKEAKVILQDFGGGDGSFLVRISESYTGKFAISFMHEGRVKHVVIETRPDTVTGVLYYITPQGPCFDSLTGLIEEAKRHCIIKNQLFDVVLKKSPPKPDQRWLHKSIKSFSHAEKLMKRESREGSYLVYKTSSDYAPYSLVYRYKGSIIHSPILSSQRSSHAYTLNGVSAPVLYKLINYYMENPINEDCVLVYPIEDKESNLSNCAITSSDSTGDPLKNELCFTKGTLITNISRRSNKWCVGDHRGDRQKFFPTSEVRFLKKDELQYIKQLKVALRQGQTDQQSLITDSTHTLNLQTEYTLSFSQGSLDIIIKHSNAGPELKPIKISCPSLSDCEDWHSVLETHHCLPRRSSEAAGVTKTTVAGGNKRKGRKKRGSCVIS